MFRDNYSLFRWDFNSSDQIFRQYLGMLPSKENFIEIGGMVGHVTRYLVQEKFHNFDLLEKSAFLMVEAKKHLHFVRNFYCKSIEKFRFKEGEKYDCVWI